MSAQPTNMFSSSRGLAMGRRTSTFTLMFWFCSISPSGKGTSATVSLSLWPLPSGKSSRSMSSSSSCWSSLVSSNGAFSSTISIPSLRNLSSSLAKSSSSSIFTSFFGTSVVGAEELAIVLSTVGASRLASITVLAYALQGRSSSSFTLIFRYFSRVKSSITMTLCAFHISSNPYELSISASVSSTP